MRLHVGFFFFITPYKPKFVSSYLFRSITKSYCVCFHAKYNCVDFRNILPVCLARRRCRRRRRTRRLIRPGPRPPVPSSALSRNCPERRRPRRQKQNRRVNIFFFFVITNGFSRAVSASIIPSPSLFINRHLPFYIACRCTGDRCPAICPNPSPARRFCRFPPNPRRTGTAEQT